MCPSMQQSASTGWKHVTSAASTAWTPFRLRRKRRTISSSSWSRRMMCLTFGRRVVCATSTVKIFLRFNKCKTHLHQFQAARVARICFPRTSTDGSGQLTARRSSQPTAIRSDSVTIHGRRPDTKKSRNQTTPSSTSIRPRSRACRFLITFTTMELHG